MKEFKTTGGSFEWTTASLSGRYYPSELIADDPIMPDGDGWKMVGSAASGTTILWFWERES